MPIMNLNPAARQRHQIRVITVGFFRMLKSMHTYKVLKTKAEILVLKEFLSWLEKCNADTPHSLGTILIYNEQRKFVPFMILEAMGKYGLLPRFFSTVKGFADGYAMAEAQLVDAAKYFSLKQLSKAVMHDGEAAEADSDADAEAAKATADKERDDFEGDAAVRVRLAYQIVERIAAKPKVAGNADDGHADHGELVREHVTLGNHFNYKAISQTTLLRQLATQNPAMMRMANCRSWCGRLRRR